MMKKYIFVFFLSILSIAIDAQETKEKPQDYLEKVKTLDSTIETLYAVISGEKGEARDWKLFKYLFKPEAKLIPTGKNNEGEFMVRYMKPDDYVKDSGKWLVENGFFEKEIYRKTDGFGNIAQVFSTYESFKSKADEKPFMRGINSIQLLYDGQRWWVINIFWTQETEYNIIPKAYLPKKRKQS
tara:strand:+ start:2075 stop:2626 length:552 start_codon:yes stop_codon:yes gene_type:complete